MYIVIVMALIQLTGATHLSWLNTEIFRECYSEGQPHDDFVKITFRNCQIVCQLSLAVYDRNADTSPTVDTERQLQGSFHTDEQDRPRETPSFQL